MMRNLLCCSLSLLSFLCVPTSVFGQKNPRGVVAARSGILSNAKVLSVDFSAERQTPALTFLIFKNGFCTKTNVESFPGNDRNAFGRIFPNPSACNEVFVNIISADRKRIRIEYVSSSGQLIGWQQREISPGTSRVTLKNQAQAYGRYLIRFSDQDDRILDVQSFIRN